MQETEIGRMVVRLAADTLLYQKGMTEAIKSAEKTGKEVSDAVKPTAEALKKTGEAATQAAEQIESAAKPAVDSLDDVAAATKSLNFTTMMAGAMAAFPVILQISQAVYEWSPAVKAFNRELERSEELGKAAAKALAERTADTLALAGSMGAGEGAAFLQGKIEQQVKEIDGLKGAIRGAENEAARFEPTWLSLWQADRMQWKLSLQNIEDHKTRLSEAKEVADQYDKAMKKMELSAEQYHHQLKAQNLTFGMTTEQAKLYQFQLAGLNEETLRGIAAETEALAAKKEAKKVQDEQAKVAKDLEQDVASYVQTLERQITSLQGVGEEFRLYELSQRGASAADQQRINRLIEMKDQLEATKKAQRENERAAKEAQRTAEREAKQIADQGRRIIEQNMTPLEKFRKEIADLQRLLKAGAIDQVTYSRAVEAGQKDLVKSVMDTTGAIKDLDAVRAGSKEAREAINRSRFLQDSFKAAGLALKAAGSPGTGIPQSTVSAITNPKTATSNLPGGGLETQIVNVLRSILTESGKTATATETLANRDSFTIEPAGFA